jgi:hypothetical protein
MTQSLKFFRIGTCTLAIAVLVIGVAVMTPEAMAQNNTEGLGVPLNATGAQSSPEAMNNTVTPMGPENETVITN